MAAWNIPLQIASYKGTTFDVISIDESNDKSLIEHAYPYVDGADLEDMGLGTHAINMSALYWDFGFDAKIKNLLATLVKKGSGVLVHPVMGRIPDMVVASYSVRYQADDVNYVAIDMSFRKSTIGNPIFISSNSLICLIDSAFASLNSFIGRVNDVISQTLGAVLLVRQQLNAFEFAISSTFKSVQAGFDGLFERSSTEYSSGNHSSQSSSNLCQGTHDLVSTALRIDLRSNRTKNAMQKAGLGSSSIMNEQVGSISAMNGYVDSALKTLPANTDRFINNDLKALIKLVFILTTTTLLSQSAVSVLESDDEITPPEVMKILAAIRRQIQVAIEACRANQLLSADNRYQMVEALRNQAATMNDVAQAAVNRKPPLLVKAADDDTSMHQLAHGYYADYRRADELIRLNPHIRHPSFIAHGDLINAYSE